MTNNYLNSFFNELSSLQFIINSVIDGRSKIGLGKVISVDKDKKLVDIQPLSSHSYKDGQEIPQVPVYGISYFRLQAGKNAIIIDPKVGDIGVYACADRDISRIVATKKASIPATNRKDSPSDAIYFGSVLGDKPEQFIEIKDDGIYITTPNDIFASCKNLFVKSSGNIQATCKDMDVSASGDVNIKAVNVKIDASSSVNIKSPSINLDSNVTANSFVVNGINVENHVHGGVQTGTGTTGGMQ